MHEEAKKAAGLKALEFVHENMLIGLGTGSTARYFILGLIEKCRAGLKIEAVATSLDSESLAREGGIAILDIHSVTSLDLVVDGADEVDKKKRLIKGAGGALVREKIIASMSQEMIVVVDESKMVDKLGQCPLPVEVLPFGAEATKRQLEEKGFSNVWRKNSDGSHYMTDNHNWILDISFKAPPENPEEAHCALINQPGVVDTGFFFGLAKKIIIGCFDGSIKIQQ